MVPAYPSIVGGGENGCILHYTSNRSQLNDGDLLLIDAGAEYDCYASDITRTFPVNGRFTPAQKALYEVVLAAQAAAIEQVQPGNHWNDPPADSITPIRYHCPRTLWQKECSRPSGCSRCPSPWAKMTPDVPRVTEQRPGATMPLPTACTGWAFRSPRSPTPSTEPDPAWLSAP